MGTIIRGLAGTPQDGLWRVECRIWFAEVRSFRAAWEEERKHLTSGLHRTYCLEPLWGDRVESSPEEWPPAGYLGPSWDDLLPTPPAPPKPRGRVLVGAARALVGTVSGRPS